MASYNFHIVSNRNNRNLQRTGNRSYKTRKGEFLGRDIPRTDKPIHDQYNYSDRTPSVWKRAIMMGLYLSIAAGVIYALLYINFTNCCG